MRTGINRAFRGIPQLDGLTDAERRAFVKRTRRGWWLARITRTVMPWFVGVLTLVVSIAFIWRCLTWGLQAKALDAASELWTGLVVASFVVPLLLGYAAWSMARTRLTRRRIREAIEDGVLPGTETQVPGVPRARTRRRRYVVELAVMVAVTAAMPLYIGLEYWSISRESARARALKPGVPALQKLIDTLPPMPGKADANVWLQFIELWRKVDEVEDAVWKEAGSPTYFGDKRVRPGYSYIGVDVEGVPENLREGFVPEKAMAERMMPALERAGVYKLLGRISGNANVDSGLLAFEEPVAIGLLPRPGVRDTFNAAKVNLGRMAAAIQARDGGAFAEAHRDFVAFARIFEREPFAMSRAYELSIDALANEMILRGLMSKPDERWLGAVGPLLEAGRPRVPFAYTLEAARLTEIDTVCYEFADARGVAQRRAQLLYTWFKEGKGQRLGTLDENLRSIDTHFIAMTADLSKPKMDRSNRSASPKAGLLFENSWRNTYWSLVSSSDRNEVDRRGLEIVCAVERYKCANGRYPAALSDLVPGQLAALPLDTWSGRPFSYKLVDPSSDPHGRSFLVYIWGNDGIDNGGTGSRPYYNAVVPGAIPDIDYVINTPHDQ